MPDSYDPSAAEVADRLAHHLIPGLDPCQDRGVDWPCDVAVVCRFAITDPDAREVCDLEVWGEHRWETWALEQRRWWDAADTAARRRYRDAIG